MIIQWSLNGLRFQILVNSLEENVSFWTSFRAFMANIFMSAMTPSQTGGGALQIYILNRAGVPVAKAFSGCLMGAVLTVFCLVFSSLVILLLEFDTMPKFGRIMDTIFGVVSIIFLFLTLLFILSLFKIRTIKRMFGRTLLFLTKFSNPQRRLSTTKKLMRGLDQYSRCMSIYARTKKLKIFIAGVLTMTGIFVNSMIAPVLLTGLNVNQNIFRVFTMQFLLFFISYFSPTPGASGVAEFSNYWIMTSIRIEQSLLGIYTLVWRFFTSFVGVGVGGLIVLGLFRKRKPRKIKGESV